MQEQNDEHSRYHISISDEGAVLHSTATILLASRPWEERVWVLQELVLAKIHLLLWFKDYHAE